MCHLMLVSNLSLCAERLSDKEDQNELTFLLEVWKFHRIILELLCNNRHFLISFADLLTN